MGFFIGGLALKISEAKMNRIVQKVKFETSPAKLYNLLLDSKKHSQATGSKVVVSRKVGGRFSAWDGYILGKNLFLVPGSCLLTMTHTAIAGPAKVTPRAGKTFIGSRSRNT